LPAARGTVKVAVHYYAATLRAATPMLTPATLAVVVELIYFVAALATLLVYVPSEMSD
jgi:hypothetical protein